MPNLIESLAPLYVDHVAVTTARFEEALADYLAAPGARIVRGPGYNDMQHVRYAFVRLEVGLTIEILGLPEDGGGPIASHVARGGGAYHLCYAVADIEKGLAAAEASGARVVSRPKPDPAHDGRPVAFLIDPVHGLVELVAAYPATFEAPPAIMEKATTTSAIGRAVVDFDDATLLSVFRSILKSLSDDEIRAGVLGRTQGWDSLAQLQLVMETERRMKLHIPMQAIEKLKTYRDFCDFVSARS